MIPTTNGVFAGELSFVDVYAYDPLSRALFSVAEPGFDETAVLIVADSTGRLAFLAFGAYPADGGDAKRKAEVHGRGRRGRRPSRRLVRAWKVVEAPSRGPTLRTFASCTFATVPVVGGYCFSAGCIGLPFLAAPLFTAVTSALRCIGFAERAKEQRQRYFATQTLLSLPPPPLTLSSSSPNTVFLSDDA